jgi:hypothetical protein
VPIREEALFTLGLTLIIIGIITFQLTAGESTGFFFVFPFFAFGDISGIGLLGGFVISILAVSFFVAVLIFTQQRHNFEDSGIKPLHLGAPQVCRHCGAETIIRASFCPICGTPLTETDEP